MRTPHPTLTPQELAIMKVVWKLDKATVRDVYEALREKRPIAYTTVMTMMKILEEKGYLKKSRPSAPMSTSRHDRASRSSARWSATSWTACSMVPRAACCCILRRTAVSRKTSVSTSGESLKILRIEETRTEVIAEIEYMMDAATLSNILSWSIQVAAITVVAALVPLILHVDAPAIRHGWWRAVLLSCLARCRILQPWQALQHVSDRLPTARHDADADGIREGNV